MTIAELKEEIARLEEDLDADEIEAAEKLADSIEGIAPLLRYRWALRSTRRRNVVADAQYLNALHLELESLVTEIHERERKDADYRDGTSG